MTAAHAGLVRLQGVPARERARTGCELCGLTLTPDHPHLVDQQHMMICVCGACAILFDGAVTRRYRRVWPRAERLRQVHCTADLWRALGVPVGLAFLVISSLTGTTIARYPGPAGTTAATVDPLAWMDVAIANPVLQTLEPDVEAWLVNRLGPEPISYRVSLDKCYELSGLVRSSWRGVNGGDAVHHAIAQFFASLNEST